MTGTDVLYIRTACPAVIIQKIPTIRLVEREEYNVPMPMLRKQYVFSSAGLCNRVYLPGLFLGE